MRRCRFSELLRQHYSNQPIFDLESVESTDSQGGKNTFTLDGQTGLSLIPDYSSDGGHLNDSGRRLAARELIRTLAIVARQKTPQISKN